MKKSPIIFLPLMGLLFTVSCEKKSENQTSQTDSTATSKKEEKKELSDSDKDFINKAAEDGMLEVKLGKLASEKAAHKDVKQFGELLVTQHEQANNELKQYASSKSIMLPDSLGEDAKKKYDDFSKLSKAEFDKKFISNAIDEHKKDIDKFESAQKTEDPELKAWVDKTLPHLQHHLMEAQRIDSMLNTSAKGGKSKTKSTISKR